MIKAIIFDNFGVLVDPVYGSLAQGLSSESIAAILKVNELADLGEITAEVRDDMIAPVVPGGKTSIISAHRRARRNQDLLDLILKLRTKYKTAVLSNAGPGLFEEFFSKQDIERYFDDVILSYKAHLIKPNPEIYLLAADKLGVKLSECVFVDDSAQNVLAAQNLGMEAIVYRDFLQFYQELSAILK